MEHNQRKIVLVGTGFVGMSFAYALLNQNACDELVLIDIDKKRAMGEAMDLNHGLAFSGSHMKIYAGEYSDCADVDIVAICAGDARKPGESRNDLLQRNTEVFRSIISPVMESGFDGVFLIATNPVDVMAHVAQKISGMDPKRVIGSGTILDTARLRYMLGDYFSIDPRNIHAYVMGEHGDSEFVPWSQALVATKSVLDHCSATGGKYCIADMEKIAEEVKYAGAKIIESKKATYYGIGMALVRIVRAIFGNENSILTVSTLLNGEYGEKDVYVGVPCIVNRSGVREVIQLNLNEEEMQKMHKSCEILRNLFNGVNI